MSRENGGEALFQRELARVEILAGLRHALDLRYRRLCNAARSDWERLFRAKDPADACVSVRVADLEDQIRAIERGITCHLLVWFDGVHKSSPQASGYETTVPLTLGQQCEAKSRMFGFSLLS